MHRVEPGVSDYHWWELPQVSFLSSQKFCVCRNKRVFVKTNMSFVITKVCLTLCVGGGECSGLLALYGGYEL